MKKLISILAILGCLLTMPACGSNSVSSSTSNTTTVMTTEERTTTSTEISTTATTTVTSTETITTTTTVTTAIPETDPETSSNSFPNSTKEYVDYIGKQIQITDITTMAAEMIGAKEGTSFWYNDNKFEIYRYNDDDPKLKEASSGSMTISIEGFGDCDTLASVNGNYVIMYDVPDDAVISAFNSVK